MPISLKNTGSQSGFSKPPFEKEKSLKFQHRNIRSNQ
jgi:hypothetical protein